MQILATGANGQVGWELARKGPEYGFDSIALNRSSLDICDFQAVKNVIKNSDAAMVINAAAYTNVDRAESEPKIAFMVNRDGPANLAAACAGAGIPLVHISTDYVFDGQEENPYLESNRISPLGVYGKSKAAGESEIRARLREHIILRTAWVYGNHGHNFVKTMLRLGKAREMLRVVNDQVGCPTYAADIAETILKLAAIYRDRGSICWGTYHYCGKGITTWHGFAQTIFEIAKNYDSFALKDIVPITTEEYPLPAKRPANSVLDCASISKKFGIFPKPWQDSLLAMVSQLAKRSSWSGPNLNL
jgi:dTDP-4-dehydrorhamnose reductase